VVGLSIVRLHECALLIENDAEARSVAEAMIAADVPVQDVEP
jgi:hypothetical protein